MSWQDVYIQGDWSTRSGNPPVPRTVGDVISCWEKTHRPVAENESVAYDGSKTSWMEIDELFCWKTHESEKTNPMQIVKRKFIAGIDPIDEGVKINSYRWCDDNRDVASYHTTTEGKDQFFEDMQKMALYYGLYLQKKQSVFTKIKSFTKRLWNSFWDAVAINF